MIRAATWVAGLAGTRRALFAVLMGALSVLAFAPLHVWPVLFVTFGALTWLLDGCHAQHGRLGQRLKSAGIVGFCFGFGYFLAGLYWIAEAFLVEPWRHGWLIPFVLTALPGGIAMFFAAAGSLAMLLWQPGAGRVFALAIAVGLAEYARGHVLTGLPWNLVGYGLLATLPLMQLAALFGVYALSLLAVILFASPLAIFAPRDSRLGGDRGAVALACAFVLLLGLGYVWGERRLAGSPEASTGDLAGIDIVIWPETAVPFPLADSPDALLAIGAVLPTGTSLVVGSGRIVDTAGAEDQLITQRVYNSLLVIDDQGRVTGSYDKIHLVPFGEYLPLQDFLESLGVMQLTGVRGGFSVGSGSRRLAVPGAPLASPLICYEIIFPDEITERGERPGWLLNVTNDAWFGTSAGPYQHFHQAQVRAIEQGLPVARAANTGISAVIDPYGRILAEIGLGEKGVLDADLPKVGPTTPFVQFGMVLEITVLLLGFAGWFACRVQPVGPHY